MRNELSEQHRLYFDISNLLKKGDYGSMLSEIGILQQEMLVHLKKIRHDQ
jgi:hypothetical protein